MAKLTAEGLSAYAIAVHGLKGASGNIGARELKEKAADLEALAKLGEFEAVLTHNGELLALAKALLAAIGQWLCAWDAQNDKPCLQAPDLSLLKKLGHCCENFDSYGADEALERLESANYMVDGDLIVWLRQRIDASDFYEIRQRLETYCAKSA
ncbi:MAG: Hpt domain-containing protein [Eggerthellaceae bacterium]|nr:Hpt domain-containing protein [Eggerthellaceae bacterium]